MDFALKWNDGHFGPRYAILFVLAEVCVFNML